MTKLTSSFCILITLTFSSTLAKEDRYNSEVIKQYALDPKTVYNIPVGNTPTTVTFPGPLLSIDGANLSNELNSEAPLLISYIQGRHFFSVRATRPKAQAAVNVIYNNQNYVFNFFHREDSAPYRTVNLIHREQAEALRSGNSRKSLKITPKTLLSLLDRAKSYHLVAQMYPSMLEEEIDFRIPQGLATEYRDYDVTITEILRFKQHDTIVFKLKIHNKSEQDIFYQPQTVAVRIAQNVYYPSIADASGIAPALSSSVAYIAITGKPNGKRADLSVHNSFQIIVTRVDDPAKLLIP